MSQPPSSQLSFSISGLVDIIKPETDLRFNLAWSYGPFLDEVPRRLGQNEALDAAVDALLQAHGCMCCRSQVTVSALSAYSRALSALRQCLGQPKTASSSNTLCAVMLLMTCEGFLGIHSGDFSGHAEGAAKLLKAKTKFNQQDDFECMLIQTLRGPVFFEAMYNEKIVLSQREWKLLVQNRLDSPDPTIRNMMYSWSQIPDFIFRERAVRNEGSADQDLAADVKQTYDTMKESVKSFKDRMRVVEKQLHDGQISLVDSTTIIVTLERVIALAFTITIVVGCILDTVAPPELDRSAELEVYAQEILALSKRAHRFRPIGGGYMAVCLPIAWIGTKQPSVRASLKDEYFKFMEDMRHGQDFQAMCSDLGKLYLRPELEDADQTDESKEPRWWSANQRLPP